MRFSLLAGAIYVGLALLFPSSLASINAEPGTTTSSGSSSSRPTPGAGQVAVTYPVDDSRITWSSGWVAGNSTCVASSRRTTTSMSTFTVMVSSGQQIYLNIDSTDAAFAVYVNGDDQFFSGIDIIRSCSYGQVQSASSPRNINVTVLVYGILMNGRRQTGGLFDWSFQLNEVLVMDSSSSSGNTGSSGGRSPGGALGLGVSWSTGFAAMLLAGLGLAI